jgi:hypothetical protein
LCLFNIWSDNFINDNKQFNRHWLYNDHILCSFVRYENSSLWMKLSQINRSLHKSSLPFLSIQILLYSYPNASIWFNRSFWCSNSIYYWCSFGSKLQVLTDVKENFNIEVTKLTNVSFSSIAFGFSVGRKYKIGLNVWKTFQSSSFIAISNKIDSMKRFQLILNFDY